MKYVDYRCQQGVTFRRCQRHFSTVPAPSKTVLLVDDEHSYTDLLSGLLAEHLDCAVHAFSRPADALAALTRLHPAVVVTDYYMPDMNGIEFIRRAAPLLPHTNFLIISGHNVALLEDDMRRLPAVKGFLAKPFGWRALTDEIRRVWPTNVEAPSNCADATSL